MSKRHPHADVSKEVKISLIVISLLLQTTGLVLIGVHAGWVVALAVLLLAWGANIKRNTKPTEIDKSKL